MKGNSVKMFATYGGFSYFKVLSCIFSLTSVRRGDRKSSRVNLESTGSMLPRIPLSALSNESRRCSDTGKQVPFKKKKGTSFVNISFQFLSRKKKKKETQRLGSPSAFVDFPSISSFYARSIYPL